MADWFYGKDNAQHGPVSDLEIRNLIATNQITQDTVIWREGMSDWLPLKDVQDFQPSQTSSQQNANTESSSSSPINSTPNRTNNPYTSPQTQAGISSQTTTPTDGLSIASLVLGIVSIMSCYVWGLFAIPAVIFGHMSLKKINTSPTPVAGKGMAIAGLVMGYIGIALQFLIIVIFIFAIVGSTTSYTP